MKSKTAKITLLSSLALAAFGATNVFADEASTQLNSDTVAAPTADTQASEPAATEKEQSPVVTVVESHKEIQQRQHLKLLLKNWKMLRLMLIRKV